MGTAYLIYRFAANLVSVYTMLIIIWCFMSWIPMGLGGNRTLEQIRSILNALVEPYLRLFRGRIPTIGMIDISPIVAIIVLRIALWLLWVIISGI